MTQTKTAAVTETTFNWMALTSVTVTLPVARSNVRVHTIARTPRRAIDAIMRADTFNFRAFG